MSEQPSRIGRDKKNGDPLENVLEPWGVWRQWGVGGLSSPRKSPIVGINKLETGVTDKLDLERYVKIRDSLSHLHSGKELRHRAYKAWKEWKSRINGMNVPRETKLMLITDPKYGGHKYYSKIGQVLSQIHGPYYNILIRKYEDLWEIDDFCRENGWDKTAAYNKLKNARKAAQKVLRENGIKC